MNVRCWEPKARLLFYQYDEDMNNQHKAFADKNHKMSESYNE